MSDTGVIIAPTSLKTTDTMRPYSVLFLLASTVSGAPYEVTEAAPVPEKLVQGGHQYHEKSVQCRTEYQTIWDTEYQVRKCKCPPVCLYLKVSSSLISLSLSCRAYSNSSESVLSSKSSWSCSVFRLVYILFISGAVLPDLRDCVRAEVRGEVGEAVP